MLRPAGLRRVDFLVTQGQQGGLRVLSCIGRHSAFHHRSQSLQDGGLRKQRLASRRKESQLQQSLSDVALPDRLDLNWHWMCAVLPSRLLGIEEQAECQVREDARCFQQEQLVAANAAGSGGGGRPGLALAM